jgi:hypothetical protein
MNVITQQLLVIQGVLRAVTLQLHEDRRLSNSNFWGRMFGLLILIYVIYIRARMPSCLISSLGDYHDRINDSNTCGTLRFVNLFCVYVRSHLLSFDVAANRFYRLYGLFCAQVFYYWTAYKDELIFKLLVILLWQVTDAAIRIYTH